MIKTLLINLYFKSMLDFNVLKLNNTELSNFATELFFFKVHRFRVAKAQTLFKLFNSKTVLSTYIF